MASLDNEDDVNQQVPLESFIAEDSITQPSDTEVPDDCSNEQFRHVTKPLTHDADPNWQASLKSVRERNAVMFNSELMADVYFIVGEERLRVPAHKYVLSTGSSVFYTMFYGALPMKDDIAITDVDSCAFLNLLRSVIDVLPPDVWFVLLYE